TPWRTQRHAPRARQQLPQARRARRSSRAGLSGRTGARRRSGQLLAITERRKAIRRKMWPIYSQAVDATVGKHLSAKGGRNPQCPVGIADRLTPWPLILLRDKLCSVRSGRPWRQRAARAHLFGSLCPQVGVPATISAVNPKKRPCKSESSRPSCCLPRG